MCKAETEVPWVETQSEPGGYAPRTFILGTMWKVGFTLWRTLPFVEEWLFPGWLAGIYEVTPQLHGKLIVANLVNSFSAFIGYKCTYVIVVARAHYCAG